VQNIVHHLANRSTVAGGKRCTCTGFHVLEEDEFCRCLMLRGVRGSISIYLLSTEAVLDIDVAGSPT